MSNLEVAVLGAGIVGLNTVLQIQEHFANAKITLIDDKFNNETLSYGPAGIFRPGTQFGGLPVDFVKQLVEYSYYYYKNLIPLSNSGISQISGYLFSNTAESIVKNRFLENLLPVYRHANTEELHLFNNSWKFGSYFETLLTQCSLFLPWALNRFEEYGGIKKKQRINNFRDLEGKFDVVFNCTGIGSKDLCNDRHVIPIRGQLLKVYAPWIKKFYYNDLDTFVIPLREGLVGLGTCKQYESYNMKIDKHDTASIFERCVDLVPSIANSKIISEWVGLRPYRHIFRLEMENIAKIKIIHNYGHGGYGITTAPGTAHHAVKLFRKYHLNNSKL